MVYPFGDTGRPLGAHALALRHGDFPDFPFNSAFDISPKLGRHCKFEEPGRYDGLNLNSCGYHIRHEQMKVYQAGAIFGVLENKILIKVALDILRLPYMPPRYAALATGPVASVARFSQEALERAAMRCCATSAVVLKPVTDGNSKGVRMFPVERSLEDASEETRRERTRRIGDYARNYLNGSERSAWGQRYEHRGVLLEPVYSNATQDKEPVYEIKAHVIFGEPLCVKMHRYSYSSRGKKPVEEMQIEMVRERLGAPFTLKESKYSGSPRLIDKPLDEAGTKQATAAALEYINKRQRKLDKWAAKVAYFFGADWYRLDVFAGDERMGWRVNEVTYPSAYPLPVASQSVAMHNPCDDVWWQYVKKYYNPNGVGLRELRKLPADGVLTEVLSSMNMSREWLQQNEKPMKMWEVQSRGGVAHRSEARSQARSQGQADMKRRHQMGGFRAKAMGRQRGPP